MATVREVITLAARRIENGDWRAHVQSERLGAGWLVGATFVGDMGAEYAARKAFRDWWAPAAYRNDGMLLTETADEKGQRLGARCAVVALRDFAATLPG